MSQKLFNYVIGNSPYQEDVRNKGDRANPVYDKIINIAYQTAENVKIKE